MIHPTAIIYPGVEIGEGVHIGAFSVIGSPPEHRSFFNGEETLSVKIGKNVRIFEMVTIHSGTLNSTEIGDNVAIFNKSHIAHDCVIEKGAIIGGQVSLAGHTWVMEGANVSGKSYTHQWAVIGPYSILSAGSYLKTNLPPGEKWVGSPARPSGLNDVGLQRAGLSHETCVRQWGERFQILTERGRT